MSTRFTLDEVYGEINSMNINKIPTGGIGGKATLTVQSIDEGETLRVIVIANLQDLTPRVCVPQETRKAKVRC